MICARRQVLAASRDEGHGVLVEEMRRRIASVRMGTSEASRTSSDELLTPDKKCGLMRWRIEQ